MILTTAALCLALNIYHEARGEFIPGQYAVALVTMNRAGHDARNVCKVVTAKKQFSWTNKLVKKGALQPKGLPQDEDRWKTAQTIANIVLSGKVTDFTEGAKYYHRYSVHPIWRHAFEQTKVLGRHIFYR